MSIKSNSSESQKLTPHDLNPLKLLSRDEVEAIYGIAKRFLEIAACKGGGPIFVKVVRLTRYRVQDIEDWIAQNSFSSTSEADSQKGRN